MEKKDPIAHNQDMNKKKDEKQALSVIADKILDYKNKVESVPSVLVPVDKTEEDRETVDGFYQSIESSTGQLLDSKFYSLLIRMNRNRDVYFLREGTTRKERVFILANIINRVTTPVLYLNHERHIQLSTFYLLNSSKQEKKLNQREENLEEYQEEPTKQFKNITENQLMVIKESLIRKLSNTTWKSVKDLNLQLTSWEADIFSQLTRDQELIMQKREGTEDIIIKRGSYILENTISLLIEPKKD